MNTKTKIITISSGKGGVGKTCTSVNLALLLAQQGYKVCLFDADANLANINIMLKLAPEFTLYHVISGQKSLSDITLTKNGIQVIPGASGLTDFFSLTSAQQKRLLKTMQDLKTKYDYLIIDNPAGINENILSYINYSDHGVIVISPEPTSLTDAFALVRVLHKRGSKKLLNIIVNNAPHEEFAGKIFKRFSAAVEQHIGCQLNYLGYVVSDPKIATSVCLQNPVVLEFPTSPSVRNYYSLSVKLASLQKQDSVEKLKPVEHQSKTQQPNFSSSAMEHDKYHPHKQEPAVEKMSKEKLKIELIRNIKDEKIGQAALKEMLQHINNAYLKRFGDYALDLPEVLHHAVKMDRISKTTLQNLLLTLHGLYKDQYGTAYDVPTKTPYPKANSLKQETAELLIQLLQQDEQIALETDIKENSASIEHKGPQLVPTVKPEPTSNHGLIDSIRYAAMIDQ
ncbi:MAG: MinD/ParA family protein [Woeseiaceae bacterium]